MYKIKMRLHGADQKELILDSNREYTAGRTSSCDFELGDYAGISRQHFRIYFADGAWKLQVLSKFGYVLHGGESAHDLDLTPGTAFKLPPYDFYCLESAEVAHAVNEISTIENQAQSSVQTSVQTSSQAYDQDVVQYQSQQAVGFDEATYVGHFSGIAYLRMIEGSGTEETLRLEGDEWVAGRDDGCSIFLNDSKASRLQFRLEVINGVYSITDLESANGTAVNGVSLVPNKPLALRSGDVIGVAELLIHFEIRDPSFENKLAVIPSKNMELPQLPTETHARSNVVIPFPFLGSKGGVIRIDDDVELLSLGQMQLRKSHLRNKKTWIYVFIGLVILFAAFAFQGGSRENAKPVDDSSAFAKLTSAQKDSIKDTYAMAKGLMLQTKYEMAAAQLKKIHEILPEGYLDSRKMNEECDRAYRNKQLQEEAQREAEKLMQNNQRVAVVLTACEKLSQRTSSIDEMKSCLNEAFSLDPENPSIQEMMARVNQRAEQSRMRSEEKAEYQAHITRGRTLYNKAIAQQRAGDLLGAIQSYERFLSAGLPDLDGLKPKAKANIANIRQTITADVERHLQKAQSLYQAQNFRGALTEVNLTKRIDPNNEHAQELGGKIQRELTAQLQVLYSDSVLDEGLGNIEPAKEKWRHIMLLDRVDGDYYRRAKNKLRTYGSPQ